MVDDHPPGLGFERPRDLHDVRRYAHEAMASVFEVYVVHGDERYAAQAAHAAFDLADRLERDLSRFLPNSDVGRINHLAAGERTRVSPSTMECLLVARHVCALTGGAFDVSIGTGLSSLELDPDALLVVAPRAGVRVDLGGIGKGYAVDRMADLLEEWGLEEALVHGGFSSVLALEPPEDRPGWPLALSDPVAPFRVLAHPCVRQTALSASGVRKGDHIFDPRTGQPARGRRATWVAVPRPGPPGSGAPAHAWPRVAAAAVSDALATALMIMPPEEIDALCEGSPGLEAWTLDEPTAGSQGNALLRHFGGG